ncbi:hypothetical protein TWF192_004452 [Orbilia oligospora]|uniref:Protein kinase domain-containing protein n=1 Tax=Orbilia oligospora TaxID=2813651 RepID=A0A6G1MBS2_ORBOL|nr:hypothetical protein TWF679_008324 [Orbilia oligospora]KAF3229008.1 hypothetical protein TWF191_002117 [Orbilia oligospora]KAF3252651.1 hypothetical protein TWF192_004452 [Orbilia oligospora]
MKLRDFFASIKAPPLTKDQYKSTTETTILANPRNLQIDLEEWRDIKTSIKALLNPYFDRECPNLLPFRVKPRTVHSKQDIFPFSLIAFESPTECILEDVFGISGQFSSGKHIINIGSPDRVFRLTKEPNSQPNNPTPHIGRFFLEFKTSWDLPLPPNLKDLFNEHKSDPKSKYTKAIQQIYAYLCFNNLQFGVLSNYDATFFFRRLSNHKMEISPIFKFSDTGLESPVAALTYLCHYTTTQQWFLRSPLADLDPSLEENQYLLDFDADMEFVNDDQPIIDWRDMLLRREVRISVQVASVMTGSVLDKTNGTIKLQNIVLKIYDLSDPQTACQSYRELNAYKECRMLQGKFIPTVYAVGTVWGLLRVFVLENCGTAVEGEKFSRDDWKKANDILEKLHGCGITHGDLKTDNFVVSEQGHMRLIDLGLAVKRSVEDGHFEDEKREFEWLREDGGR